MSGPLACGVDLQAGFAYALGMRKSPARRSSGHGLAPSNADRDQFRRLCEATGAVPWIADYHTWQMTYIGPQVESLFGYPAARWYDTGFWESVLHEEDRERVVRDCGEAAKRGGRYELDYRMVAADGRVVWIHDVIGVSVDETGKPKELQGFFLDVSARKESELVLRQTQTELLRVLQEREELARDLHDNVIQMLFAVGLSLDLCRRMLDAAQGSKALKQLDQAVRDLNAVIEDVRRYLKGAQPSYMIPGRLAASLKQMAAKLNRAGTIRYRLAIDPVAVGRLTPEQSTHLFYIAAEAMGNCLRHSGGREVRVSLGMHQRRVCLSVRDDGSGLRDTAEARSGSGLANMRARAEKLGANLRIESSRSRGTCVHLHVPAAAQGGMMI